MPLPKLPTKKPAATEPQPNASPDYKDSYDITYVGGLAHIKVAVDVKLSRNYQSCGVQSGMEFTTKAELADAAVQNGFKKLRDALRPQIAEASNLLNEI